MNPLLHTLRDECSQALHGLHAPQTLLHPCENPSRWNIHQIVEHLLLSYSSTVSSLEDRLAKGYPTRVSATPSQRLARFVVITLGYLPSGREAPSITLPQTESPTALFDGATLSSAISADLSSLDLLLDRAEQQFHSTPCFSHFAFGPLTIQQWRRFHLIHGRHHLRQVLSIRREYHI
ncbi:DUF1569 domain-containing protein [Edaphobacter albus]|uniref:DUF1569 domain-containing protein n=1 Tax=Edaphobacter sp. 4G125 TaxID=2763071 RepID=UPI0016474553|nr:DUF1569 domain-containing protein [Edaphobacter sp. 4G125]QNI35443.1 DUF1569 domain-containing protein [Edaphobacter sp. 4G125]